jgi:XTP/dITP diphosphohydrolase
MRALLASGNSHKLDELQAALPGWEIELLGVSDFPEEVGDTYEENARGKALFGRAHVQQDEWVLGEDSGIEAEALSGRPGVHSARFGGSGSGKEKLLHELEGVEDRRARYVCAIVAIGPGGEQMVVRGTLDGTISHEQRGSEGFGYDPVFVPAGEEQTVAELGNAWKRSNSHRARAAAALLRSLSAMPQPDRSGARDESDTVSETSLTPCQRRV